MRLPGMTPWRSACRARMVSTAPAPPQQMTQLAFGGADRQMICGAAEAAPECPSLRQIAEAGAGSMGLNAAEV